MPLQNRVTPFGDIIAVPDRGTLMGNRGRLHGDRRQITRQFCSQQFWITCLTEFMSLPNRITHSAHHSAAGAPVISGTIKRWLSTRPW